MAEALNMRCGNWNNIVEAFEGKFPAALSFLKSGLDKEYWSVVEAQTRQLGEEFGIPVKGFFTH